MILFALSIVLFAALCAVVVDVAFYWVSTLRRSGLPTRPPSPAPSTFRATRRRPTPKRARRRPRTATRLASRSRPSGLAGRGRRRPAPAGRHDQRYRADVLRAGGRHHVVVPVTKSVEGRVRAARSRWAVRFRTTASATSASTGRRTPPTSVPGRLGARYTSGRRGGPTRIAGGPPGSNFATSRQTTRPRSGQTLNIPAISGARSMGSWSRSRRRSAPRRRRARSRPRSRGTGGGAPNERRPARTR